MASMCLSDIDLTVTTQRTGAWWKLPGTEFCSFPVYENCWSDNWIV